MPRQALRRSRYLELKCLWSWLRQETKMNAPQVIICDSHSPTLHKLVTLLFLEGSQSINLLSCAIPSPAAAEFSQVGLFIVELGWVIIIANHCLCAVFLIEVRGTLLFGTLDAFCFALCLHPVCWLYNSTFFCQRDIRKVELNFLGIVGGCLGFRTCLICRLWILTSLTSNYKVNNNLPKISCKRKHT